MKVWILDIFTVHTVMGHTEERMKLILTQMVPDHQYKCLLIFDKYTAIAGQDIHIIIPSWWKKFQFSRKLLSFQYHVWKKAELDNVFEHLNSFVETNYRVKIFNGFQYPLRKYGRKWPKIPLKHVFFSSPHSRISSKILDS